MIYNMWYWTDSLFHDKSVLEWLMRPIMKQLEGRIFSSELPLNKANASKTETPFLDLHLSFSTVCASKIYDKCHD